MGAGFQTDADSVVGGGKIARRTVETLVTQGHVVTIVSKLKPGTAAWAERLGVGNCTDMPAVDACLVLTGPFNPMFTALYATYEQLARFEGPVFYAWWDTALPFNFEPERVKLFAKNCKVTSADLLRGKSWTVLSQVRALPTPVEGVDVHPCFWELAEAVGDEPLPMHPNPHPAFAYFGSDRPGRLGELKRWFGHASAPPLHLYGRWSDKSLATLSRGNVEYRGPVAESEVRALLNEYTATLHSADTAYVKADFVAQRFMENAMAAVPVAYSDRIQPQLVPLVPVMRSPDDLELWWHRVQNPERRRGMVEQHTMLVRQWAQSHPDLPSRVLKNLLS